MSMPAFVSSTADVQDSYRYSLTRVWDESLPLVTFVLLNPSTADDVELDPTLRRCVGFARREQFGGMRVLNLYAFRATKPKVMLAAPDPIGIDNDKALASATGVVIAGWGTNARATRVSRAVTLLPKLKALKTTKDGHPQHPLYVRRESALIDWPEHGVS
ncbi:DUF1643 domain-containing protein [Microbacterium sp. NPDC055599]